VRISDQVVVITGASSGIGRATAHALAARCADLVLAARGTEALREVAAECRAAGAETLVVPTDVTDFGAVQELARRAVERFGRIDVWINDAAVTVLGPFEKTPLADFRRVFDVNVMGYVHGARAVLPYFRQQGSGVLVNVASIVGVLSQPYAHAYAMSKHAVRALSASLRQELRLTGGKGIKVVEILPATIDTPLFQHAGNYTGRKVVAMPPVYSPERVARSIVAAVRWPRREVVVGPAGQAMIWQWKLAQGLSERMLARQVDRTHLSTEEAAPDSPGNLYESVDHRGSVHGGWHGKRRTAVRRLALAGAGLGAGAIGTAVARYRRRS